MHSSVAVPSRAFSSPGYPTRFCLSTHQVENQQSALNDEPVTMVHLFEIRAYSTRLMRQGSAAISFIKLEAVWHKHGKVITKCEVCFFGLGCA